MNAELEREILGQLILKPELLESCEALERGLFGSEELGKAFAGITAIWADIRPRSIDLGILAVKTGLSQEFLAGLTDGNYRPDPANFAWRVREIRRRRAGERALKLAQEEGQHLVNTGEVDPANVAKILETWQEIEGLDARGFEPSRVLMSGTQLMALDINVDWTLDKLIPSRSLTLLHGPGGVGKTWLALSIAKAVAEGQPFLGLATRQRPAIYIDFENPWPMLIDRVRRLDAGEVQFWHLSAETRPPKLDGPDWTLYKSLPAGALLVFDTARAAHDGDENSSQDVGLVMNRLKEIREAGFDILLLHHTTKLNERASKGSTAWDDLADHVLAFYRAKRGTLEEIDEGGFDPDALLSLGTGKKTRYEPARLFLTMDGATGAFSLAADPGQEKLDALADYIAGEGLGKNQRDLIAWAKTALGGGRTENLVAILKRGEREGRWRSRKGLRGARTYEPST